MTKEVLVTIQGLQFDAESQNDEEMDKIESIYPGEYYFRSGSHYILYDELVEGEAAPIKNVIKLRDREFTITKKGIINTQMVFTEGKKNMTSYVTPFGNIMIALDTEKIEVKETEEELKIHIDYGLEANYQYIADCQIAVTISARK
ncbi:MAG: DUF1934 domain-containing protein [Lachnospiraceae bacterium]|nr:DUF1934 domain-containing protein [Lachnospiraceae bacterium]MBQ5852302.1 DUF1934 domain-containing protein [Lachnospiraceae bacterium]MEE1257644.1 DUF1934 domain-containing protein [Lachnospiraceae bacterium]